MPQRIQRRRTKGWKMPDGATYVGRPSEWGNPFAVGDYVDRDTYLWPYLLRALPGADPAGGRFPLSRIALQDPQLAVDAFGWWFIEQPDLMLRVKELAGKDLCCWCKPDQPCHADFLLEMASDE